VPGILSAPTFYMNIIEQQVVSLLLKGRSVDASKLINAERSSLPIPLCRNLEGMVFRSQGKNSSAEHFFREAVLLDPHFNAAKLNLANTLNSQGRYNEALQFAKSAFEEASKPSIPVVLPYLTCLLDTARVEQALEVIKTLPKALKDDRQIQLATASCLRSQQDYNGAVEILEKLLRVDPEDILALRIFADLKGEQDPQFDPIPIYERCLSLASKKKKTATAPIKWNMSLHLLRRRDFVKGWDYYDAGLDPSVGSLGRALPSPARQYRQLDFTKIDRKRWSLVVVEQGIGDQVLFLSVLNEMIADLEKVILICESRMFPILTRSFPAVQLAHAGTLEGLEVSSYPFNGIAPIGSLQRRYRKSVEDYTRSRQPFLKVSPGQYHKYRSRLLEESGGKPIVGISWKGGFWENQQRNKAIELKNWESLFRRDDVFIVNLQYGNITKDLDWLNKQRFSIRTFPDLDFKNDLDAWLSIAAACDGIISVSTALVHFAGAVNQKVAVVMPDLQGPWILGIKDSRSIVYPNVHYFRKRLTETNDDLIRRVVAIIKSNE
jgi:Tfp pilus assembly protein PilF